MNEKDNAKQRMIEVTIRLICEGKKPNEITVAEITERAGVGNGMVNYHFRSKDILLRTAVKEVMVCAKKGLSNKLREYKDISAKERLAFILKETMEAFSKNPEISRIAILDNLENDGESLHVLSDLEEFNLCIRELFGEDSCKILIANGMIAAFIDYIFLKAPMLRREIDFDFSDKEKRNNMIDYLLTKMPGNKNE